MMSGVSVAEVSGSPAVLLTSGVTGGVIKVALSIDLVTFRCLAVFWLLFSLYENIEILKHN